MAYDRNQRLQDCSDSFLRATALLKDEFEKAPSTLAIALAVTAAFASEVAMKRYIERKTGTPVHGHKLDALWNLLDSSDRQKVQQLICSRIPLDPARFDEYLGKCSSTFVDWRYMYERDDNFTNYLFLYYLADEVRKLG